MVSGILKLGAMVLREVLDKKDGFLVFMKQQEKIFQVRYGGIQVITLFQHMDMFMVFKMVIKKLLIQVNQILRQD